METLGEDTKSKKKDGLAAILKTDKRMRGRKQIVQVADNNKNVAIIFKRLMSMQIEDWSCSPPPS